MSQDPTNRTLINITYYYGPGDSSPYLLSKKYIVQNWQDEADLRRILDEIAGQLNHITGYGILKIEVAGEDLKFRVDYKERIKPFEWDTQEYYLGFEAILRFEVGRKIRWRGGPARLEIPRLRYTTGYNNPIKKCDPDDNIFQIKAIAVGRGKKIRQAGTIYHLHYDRENPILKAFLKNITEGGVFAPVTKRPIQYHRDGYVAISWWELPKTQWSWSKWQKLEKQEEKEKKRREKLKKSGIVYKDKKRTKKADQVYIIGMEGEGVEDVYKIGVSNNPKKRLQALNTSNPFPLKMVHMFVAEPAADAETLLHTKFEETRTSGEWFRLTAGQIGELKQITEFKNGRFIKDEQKS